MARTPSTAPDAGDFQTPSGLAKDICRLLARRGVRPASIVEPTCGKGAFLLAGLEVFPEAARVLGVDLNEDHVGEARMAAARAAGTGHRVEIVQGDFFGLPWSERLAELPDPLLVIGNPPWITNAAVAALGGSNRPERRNHDQLSGIDALTGKSNFDISEWMLRRSVEWFVGRRGHLAVLCKTGVARKLLAWAWGQKLPISSAAMYSIDAIRTFGAAVDACLLWLTFSGTRGEEACSWYESLGAAQARSAFGLCDGRLVADVPKFERVRSLYSPGLSGWRSGIKHDCSAVFELDGEIGALRNGHGETVDVEPEVVFPLLKSSDLAGKKLPRKRLLVTQRRVDEDPSPLERGAPRAWRYLTSHRNALASRRSSIYKGRPEFSIFGVGEYTFSPWKVAISGLYKSLIFSIVGPHEGKPVVFDDTCYFFACESEREAQALLSLLESAPAVDFLESQIFWDAKRPVSAQLLNSLDLASLRELLGVDSSESERLAARQITGYREAAEQLLLVREEERSYASQ